MTRAQSGFSLTEVVVAMGLATFAMLAIIGLLPVSVASTRNAVQGTAAASVASRIVEDLQQSALANKPRSQLFDFSLTPGSTGFAALATDGMAATNAATATYRATVRIASAPVASLFPGERAAYHASIRIHWPAAAEEAGAQGAYDLATTVRLAP